MNDVCFIEEKPEVKIKAKRRETFLLADNIDRIKIMFADEESYEKYMGALWLLRDLIGESIDICGKPNVASHSQFPIFELTNDLISALLRQDTYFTVSPHGITYYRHKERGED